ncbi:MAG: LuxR C-terminal-related transcriptional regulator, partial [Lacipirellulaceae bacterium]
GDVPSAVKALKLGAVDYLEKPLTPQELLQKAHEGIGTSSQRWIELSAEQERISQLESLSPREREVAELLVSGMNTKQIARQLEVSPKTVETHRPNIFNKLGIDSVVELSRLITPSLAEAPLAGALQASP